MTRLLLVRHGETDWNAQRRHQGQTDIPLNVLGRQQAQAVGDRLKGETIDIIYASDLERAMETAQAIAAYHDLPIHEDSRLREMHFGEWEGLTYEEIQQRKPMTPDAWNKIMMEDGPPGGENLPQFAARIKAAIEEITSSHPDETVLLVAHSGTLMILICMLLKHPIEKYWQFRLDRTSVSEISTYPDGAIITLLNDTCHLES